MRGMMRHTPSATMTVAATKQTLSCKASNTLSSLCGVERACGYSRRK